MRGLGPFLTDAWRLARPYFYSDERWSARGLLGSIVVLNLSLVGMDVVLSFWNRAFYNALQDKDWDAFIGLLFLYRRTADGIMPGFCLVASLYIVVAVYRTYLNQWLRIRWRRWMTGQLLTSWLADRVYYRLSLQTPAAAPGGLSKGPDAVKGTGVGTDNPDQRISEDLNSFVTDGLSLSLDLLSNVVSLASFVVILWGLSGAFTLFGIDIPGYMVWVALIYAIAGTVLTHLIGRPLAALNFRQQRVEADFRFSLVRLRENVEGVALYHGEDEEHRGLDNRFEAVVVNWWAIMRRTKLLNALVSGYGQIAVVFPIIVAAPRYFSGAMTLGGLTQTSGAFNQVQSAMSWFVNSYASIASWRATVERLATFQSSIEAARAAERAGTVGLAVGNADEYRLDDVTIALPSGQPLLEHAALVLPRGQSVVITGRSGAGKSTLFRALAGIWPFGAGQVAHPDPTQPGGRSLFLPQRPYIPLGTLRHAVCYPGDPTDFTDTAVRAALDDAGLSELAPRLDEEDNWAQRLSGGEQQRLAIARALLTRPDWLFLDEATASLDPEAEAELYAMLQTRLPATTLVSIAHRPSVAALHERHIVFERSLGGLAKLAA